MPSSYDAGVDDREAEVADMARRAAQAASDRRKRIRDNGTSLTAEDVDGDALAILDQNLEELASWTPGFSGAMMFRGSQVQPLVSLITASEQEAMRRSLMHVAASVRNEMELIKGDSIGSFVDSVTSTTQGAVIVNVFGDDILVVAIHGRPAKLADAWHALSQRRAAIAAAAGALISESR